MLSVVMNLHRFHVRRRNLAVGALVLCVAALLHAGPVGLTGLAAAPVGGRGVDLRRDLLRRVLLRLRLTCHGDLIVILEMDLDRRADIEGEKPKRRPGTENPNLKLEGDWVMGRWCL